MLIAEEFLLLCLEDESGKRLISGERMDPALGGGLLADLALRERIGITADDAGWTQRARVTITSLTPTDDPELDRALQSLAQHEGKKVKDMISGMSTKRITRGLRVRLLQRLAAAGTITEQRGTVLGFIPRTTWPTRDAGPEDEIRQRLHSTLVAGLTPTERTVSLIALLLVTGLLPKVVATEDTRGLKARAKALTEGDWVARAVKQAIQDAEATAAAAAT